MSPLVLEQIKKMKLDVFIDGAFYCRFEIERYSLVQIVLEAIKSFTVSPLFFCQAASASYGEPTTHNRDVTGVNLVKVLCAVEKVPYQLFNLECCCSVSRTGSVAKTKHGFSSSMNESRKRKYAYDFNMFALKKLKFAITPALTNIPNHWIMHSIFLDAFKLAKITPFRKDGDLSQPGFFKPISITPSNFFERLLYNRITSYLENFNLLTPNHFGCRQKLGTFDVLLEQSQNVWSIWENKFKNVIEFLFVNLKKKRSLLLSILSYSKNYTVSELEGE